MNKSEDIISSKDAHKLFVENRLKSKELSDLISKFNKEIVLSGIFYISACDYTRDTYDIIKNMLKKKDYGIEYENDKDNGPLMVIKLDVDFSNPAICQ